MKIIIVDDEECIRDTLSVFAQMAGYETITKSSPLEFEMFSPDLCKCPLKSVCCDILLVDQNMIGIKGLDFLRKIKEVNCRIVTDNIGIMSGDLSSNEISVAKQLGCKILEKPVTCEVLYAWLDDIKAKSCN